MEFLTMLILHRAAPTFPFPVDGEQVLTFGTCQFFLFNNGDETIDFCWSQFVRLCLLLQCYQG